ncbi:MAG TPA: hypothetical protein VE258_13345, partial [Ktedonobacterales bacterium]|nr:hypothetical protein [Ktedonobacterales bacterium]
STDEIIQLGQELENYQRWERVRDYVALLYPPEARRVTISVISDYNDNTFDEDVHVLVTDRAGALLSFDFSRPWWGEFVLSEQDKASMFEDKSGAISNLDEPVQEAIKVLCTDLLGIEFLQFWQPHDPVTYDYFVDTPPTISHSEIYVVG